MCKMFGPEELSDLLLLNSRFSPPRLRGLAEVSCFLLQDAQQGLGALQDLEESK